MQNKAHNPSNLSIHFYFQRIMNPAHQIEPLSRQELSMHPLAVQAAINAKLNQFSKAYKPDPAQAKRIEANFAKTCSPTTKLVNVCDSGLVKQLFFIQPNYKAALLSCPFATQCEDGEELTAGSFGHAMDVICPVTIRLKDVRSEIISVCPSRIAATKYKLAVSTSNPLDEDGPLLEGGMVDAEPARPDRIHVDIQDPAIQPCFIAIPKVLPFTGGYTLELDPAISVVTTVDLPNVAPDSPANTWFQTIKYGVNHLDNFSIHAKDILFVYEGLEKGDFIATNRNLASRCTVRVTTLTYDDPIYHKVIRSMRNEKEKANLSFRSKLLATTAMPSASTRHQTPPTTNPMVATPTAPVDAYKELISEIT